MSGEERKEEDKRIEVDERGMNIDLREKKLEWLNEKLRVEEIGIMIKILENEDILREKKESVKEGGKSDWEERLKGGRLWDLKKVNRGWEDEGRKECRGGILIKIDRSEEMIDMKGIEKKEKVGNGNGLNMVVGEIEDGGEERELKEIDI